MMQKSQLDSANTMLSCENIACTRRGRHLFSGLHMQLKAGEACALAGANGSGKSSLLKIIAGLLPPDEGAVLFQGKPIRKTSDYEGQVLYIGHKNAIKPEASVRDNVMFWADMAHSTYLAAAAIDYFSLGTWLDMPAGAMSAGWQRRVTLTKLITMPAKLWLLDEAANNLDADGVALLGGLVNSRTNSGGAVIFAAHGLPSAEVAKESGFQLVQLDDFMTTQDQDEEEV